MGFGFSAGTECFSIGSLKIIHVDSLGTEDAPINQFYKFRKYLLQTFLGFDFSCLKRNYLKFLNCLSRFLNHL